MSECRHTPVSDGLMTLCTKCHCWLEQFLRFEPAVGAFCAAYRRLQPSTEAERKALERPQHGWTCDLPSCVLRELSHD